MDVFLLIIGFLIMLIGIAGAFIPVIPGTITSWAGLLVLYLTNAIPMNWTVLGITLFIAIAVFIVDYIIPAIGTKKFGGTKYGVVGTLLGLLLGIFFFPPFGLIIGPFVGAYLGEMMHDSSDSKRALKAAFGSFIGFISSTFLKFATSTAFLVYYILIFWEYRAALIGF